MQEFCVDSLAKEPDCGFDTAIVPVCMDSDSDSPLSVISSADLEELREELEGEFGELSIEFDHHEELDGDGFSTSQIAAAILESRREQSAQNGESSAGPSVYSMGLPALQPGISNGTKRRRSQFEIQPTRPIRRSPFNTDKQHDFEDTIHSPEQSSISKVSDELPPSLGTSTNITKLSPAVTNGLSHSDHATNDVTAKLGFIEQSSEYSAFPSINNSEDEEESAQPPEPTSKAKKSKARTMPKTAKKAAKNAAAKSAAARKMDRLWEVDTVVTDPDSPLVAVNIQSLLMKDEAWTTLSKDQQRQLISMLPNAPNVEPDPNDELPNLLQATLQKSAAMKADIRLFKEDLGAGRLEPEWQLMARRAIQRRANGDFDEYEKQKREEIWGEKQDESEADEHAGEDKKKRKGKKKR